MIRSWLIDLLAKGYESDPLTNGESGYVEDTGEVNWLIEDALRMEVPVPVIAQSVMQLFQSRDQSKVWARAIASMRHAFGGHPFGRDERIGGERRTSRIGDGLTPATD